MNPTPRIVALVNWYDESPLWLSASIISASPHIDHVIACDGAYALFPQARAQSRIDQAQSIAETCQALGLGLTLHRPGHVWIDNEIGKRNFMFRLAELVARPNVDWLMPWDADYLTDRGIPDLRQQLAATSHDVAEVMVIERGDPYRNPARLEYESKMSLPPDSHFPLRALFRAIPGLTCGPEHWHYTTPDGRRLWGPDAEPLEPALDLHDFRIEHRTHHRPLKRHEDAQTYYRRRSAAGIEAQADKAAA